MSTTAATSTGFTVTKSSASLWRVTFNNPPINLIDPPMIGGLEDLLTEIEDDKHVAVVLFDSADPDYFLAHYDIAADQTGLGDMKTSTGLHPWADVLIRLSTSPAVTITAIRGRARAAGSEFTLASDVRFASRSFVGQQEP